MEMEASGKCSTWKWRLVKKRHQSLRMESASCASVTGLMGMIGLSSNKAGHSRHLRNIGKTGYSQILLTMRTVLDPNLFRAPWKLNVRVNYAVGDVVIADIFQCRWYTTAFGAFGGIVAMNSQGFNQNCTSEHGKHLKMLLLVEMEFSFIIFQMTGCDHTTFRNRHYPAANGIDAFMSLSNDQKIRIARKVADTCKGYAVMKAFETLTAATIELETTRCANDRVFHPSIASHSLRGI
jgi:hypothetical protein